MQIYVVLLTHAHGEDIHAATERPQAQQIAKSMMLETLDGLEADEADVIKDLCSKNEVMRAIAQYNVFYEELPSSEQHYLKIAEVTLDDASHELVEGEDPDVCPMCGTKGVR